jgi:hypothetical protein
MLLAFAEKNPGMVRVMTGDALVGEHERLQARMNQFYDRFESTLKQALRAPAEAARTVRCRVARMPACWCATRSAACTSTRNPASRRKPTESLAAQRRYVRLDGYFSQENSNAQTPDQVQCFDTRDFAGRAAGISQQPPTGARVVASEPGKAAVAETIQASAAVVAIDKASRTLSLKASTEKSSTSRAPGENFDQIKVGDEVVVQYVRALTLELKKSGGKLTARSRRTPCAPRRAREPGGAVGRQVTVMTKVIDVDPRTGPFPAGPQGQRGGARR